MSEKPINLSQQLLKFILVIYLLITLVITTIHMAVEYQYTKNDIQNELQKLSVTFKSSIQTALWELNPEQLESIADGVVQTPIAYAIQINDPNGKEVVSRTREGVNFEELKSAGYVYTFPVHHVMNGERIHLGDVQLFSSSAVVIERLKVGFLMILLSAFIKTAVLILLFYLAFRRFLERPLRELTEKIVNLRWEEDHERKISMNFKHRNELNILYEKFNELLEKIVKEEQKQIQILSEVNVRLEQEVLHRTRELERLAITDSLTQLYNRGKIEDELEKLFKYYERYGRMFTIIIIDIDFFKSVNDTYGHQEGDRVLNQIAQIIRTYTRQTDIVGRWGGEEFLIACTETLSSDAYKVAETIRHQIETFDFGEIGYKSASFGIAQMQEGLKLHELIARADKALYKAKQNGRNRTEID